MAGQVAIVYALAWLWHDLMNALPANQKALFPDLAQHGYLGLTKLAEVTDHYLL